MEAAAATRSQDLETPTKMRAIVHRSYGSADGVELREIDRPAIEDHQVLVRVHASSVNPAEWYGVMGPIFIRPGSGLLRPKQPGIGGDLAGTIEAVGKDVTEFEPGDEVFGTSGASWAEYAPAREARLVRKPANVSFEEAAVRADRGHHRPPGSARQGARPARAEGADQRRVGRRRHVRGPDREGAGSRRDCRVQHEERRARPFAGSGPRRRLHAGGLHAERRASRAHARRLREPQALGTSPGA